MNYLEYIQSIEQSNTYPKFVVSGVDTHIRNIVGNNIIEACHRKKKTLFIVDNTRNDDSYHVNIKSYGRIFDLLDGNLCLCQSLFQTNTLVEISRFRRLLFDIGFDYLQVQHIVVYIDLVKEIERQLGNRRTLTFDKLEEYGSPMLIELKLNKLLESRKVSQYDYKYLIEKFFEVSAASADFEAFFDLIKLLCCNGKERVSEDIAIYFQTRKVDDSLVKIIMSLLTSELMEHLNSSTLLIIADNVSENERNIFQSVLHKLPDVEVHLLTDNVWTFNQEGQVLQSFDVKIFSRHNNMFACQKIQEYFGEFDVVKKSYTTTVDKRFRANSAWDILFGNNRTETEIRNIPSREYLFRKERINTLPSGYGILEVGGQKTMMSFSE